MFAKHVSMLSLQEDEPRQCVLQHRNRVALDVDFLDALGVHCRAALVVSRVLSDRRNPLLSENQDVGSDKHVIVRLLLA